MNSTDPIRIGYSLSLTGPLGSNGRTAQLAQKIWEEDVNRKGGLLGRQVQLRCIDDQSQADRVPEIYTRLLDVDKVDLALGGYGNNSIAPAMPLVIARNRYFVGLMGLSVNAPFKYSRYFAMIPTGPNPNSALTEGFFEIAARQNPKPATLAILAADAPFSRNPVLGAKENAAANGFSVVFEQRYPLSTKDYIPVIRQLESLNPDILFLCSYLNDSVGLIRAISETGLQPRIVGGAMIGPQNGAVKAELGSMLNGLVNYEYWLPVPELMFPGVREMIAIYQSRAAATEADPLGHYVAPQAYAQMQIIEQAISGTRSLDDDKLTRYTRDNGFKTVVGEVKFGRDGEWAVPRVLQVQFQGISGNGIDQFRSSRTQVVVAPKQFGSGDLIYPFARAGKLGGI
jgi:branched-chain amino acid transport system substrate-binding protein